MDISELARAAELTECQRQLAEARAALNEVPGGFILHPAERAAALAWQKKHAAALKAAEKAAKKAAEKAE
jgi:hypothetical protein